MNEPDQNRTIDYYVNKCPMFNGYLGIYHNIEVKTSPSRTICEIDNYIIFDKFVLLGENKTTDSYGCHKSMEKQIPRFKRYENLISRQFGTKGLPVFYFYAHFEKDRLHIEYKGVKIPYKKK